nr:uncharacterized protein LOC109762251 [Aegilops tauschii subsp. strangulata]
MATERYRRNSIASLKLSDGTVVTDHSQMEGIIWNCFKNRMGSSRGINMGFDLSSLIEPVVGLDTLTKPFEKEEMDMIVKHMPVDKAPGPDGFNGLFFKRCWHIISHDFYELAQAFFEGTANLENINDSYITRVPKKPSPEEVGDFRPISLTGMGLKFLSKMVANRFQEAFDSLEHEAIVQILKYKGFNDKWILWMKQLLSTAADLLQTVINDMFRRGILQLPIPCHDQDYPVIHYADDTLIILPVDKDHLIALKEMLRVFSVSTGLDVNHHKSFIIPINVDTVALTELASAFGCQIGKMPFTNLRLPVVWLSQLESLSNWRESRDNASGGGIETRETRDHLFFNCNFSVRVWNYLQIDWASGDSMAHLALNASRSFRKPFFTEVVFIA